MSFLAKLVLGSSEFNIISIDYDIIQPVDQQGKPNGKPKGGMINVTIESSNKNDLAEWMISPTMKKSGQITFFKRDANSSMKTMAFNEAYCVYYKERFNAVTEHPMTIEIRISAGELKLNNTSISNPWSSVAAIAKDAVAMLGVSSLFDSASSMGETAMNKVNEVKEKVEQKIDEAKEKAQEVKKEVETKVGEIKDEVEQKIDEAKEKAEEVKQEVEEKVEEAKEKAEEIKQEAEEKVEEAKEKAEEVKQEVEEKAEEVQQEAEEKVEEVQQEAEQKAEEAQQEAEQKAEEAQEEIGSFIP